MGTEQHKSWLQHLIDQIGYHGADILPSDALKFGNLGRDLRSILGNYNTISDLYTDINAALAAIASASAAKYRPTVSLLETWQSGIINPAIWSVTNPVGGAAWAIGVAPMSIWPLRVAPNASENCRLVSVQPWQQLGTTYGTAANQARFIIQRTVLEWEMIFGDPPSRLDPAGCFWGMSINNNAIRTTTGLFGFSIVDPGGGNQLQTVSDSGGAEEVYTGFGTDLTASHKYKIDVGFDLVTALPKAFFYVDGVLVSTHTTNLGGGWRFLNWYTATNATGAMGLNIGHIRAWNEDVVR